MNAHEERIRRAERTAWVYDDLPWEVGDVAHSPSAEDLPEGTVLIDPLGNPWHLIDTEWYTTGIEAHQTPPAYDEPYEVAWLPKEN